MKRNVRVRIALLIAIMLCITGASFISGYVYASSTTATDIGVYASTFGSIQVDEVNFTASSNLRGQPTWAALQTLPTGTRVGNIQFIHTGLTTTRGYIFPDENGTVVTIAASQTLTSKTLTSPTIQGTVGAGTGLTMPAFTLGGGVTATGQTITAGTLSGSTLSGTIAGTPTISGAWTWSVAQTLPNIVLSSGSASRLLATDSAKNLTSVANLASWIAGTSNQITVVDDGDGTITLSTPQSIATSSSPSFAGLTLTGNQSIAGNYLKTSNFAIVESSTNLRIRKLESVDFLLVNTTGVFSRATLNLINNATTGLQKAGSGASTDVFWNTNVAGDSAGRFVAYVSGQMEWGPGNNVRDQSLSRQSVAYMTPAMIFRNPQATNTYGSLGVAPVGTDTRAMFLVFGTADIVTNAEWLGIDSNTENDGKYTIASQERGSGTLRPIIFSTKNDATLTNMAIMNTTSATGWRIRFGDKGGAADTTDFWLEPAGGAGSEGFVYDTANGRLYWWGNGGVHYVAQTAGFQWPVSELRNFDMKRGFKVGDDVVLRIDYMMSDGAPHALTYPLDDALRDSATIQRFEARISQLEQIVKIMAGWGA